MQHFLLIYDHKAQSLRDERVFAFKESDAATTAYQEAERQYQGQADIEIVLIGADSIETIQRTHGHYFDSSDRLERYLPTPA